MDRTISFDHPAKGYRRVERPYADGLPPAVTYEPDPFAEKDSPPRPPNVGLITIAVGTLVLGGMVWMMV